MTRRKFYVSGVVQFTVYAESATAAVVAAEERAARMNRGRVIVSLDCIETSGHGAVGLDDASDLDGEEATS